MRRRRCRSLSSRPAFAAHHAEGRVADGGRADELPDVRLREQVVEATWLVSGRRAASLPVLGEERVCATGSRQRSSAASAALRASVPSASVSVASVSASVESVSVASLSVVFSVAVGVRLQPGAASRRCREGLDSPSSRSVVTVPPRPEAGPTLHRPGYTRKQAWANSGHVEAQEGASRRRIVLSKRSSMRATSCNLQP